MPLIELKQVTKVFDVGDVAVQALQGISLSIFEGEFISIMGASGSGKSTLMNILGCLDTPTTGEYFLNGVLVNGLDKIQRSDIRNQQIGFVFQGFNLLPRMSALENVELPLIYNRTQKTDDERQQALKALEQVGLAHRLHHQPTQLSGGQQQRVAIARALVNRPSLLLADEPTGNLDSRTSVEVMSLFQHINEQGNTIVLVTHEPDLAKYTHRIVELRDGRILRDEPASDSRCADDDLRRLDRDAGQAGIERRVGQGTTTT